MNKKNNFIRIKAKGLLPKNDEKVMIKIPIKNGGFWEKEYYQADKIDNIINDFKEINKQEFPEEYINDWKDKSQYLKLNDEIRTLIIKEIPILSFNNKQNEENILFLEEGKIPDIIGKPFNNPFEIFAFYKKEKILKIQKYDKELIENKHLNYFDTSSAYCNGNNFLFISGGENKNLLIDKFWKINLEKQEIDTYNMMPKKNHSMIFLPGKYIFIVGGNDLKTFYFDIEINEFTEWADLNKKRNEPALALINNNLYCFEYTNSKNSNEEFTIEKTDLKSDFLEWIIINPDLNLSLENQKFNQKFFGIIKNVDNIIIFIGGNMNDKDNMNKYNYKYNVNMNTIEMTDIPFKEYILKEKTFLPFNDNIDYILPDFNRNHPEVLFYQKNKNKLNLVNYEASHIRNNICQKKLYDNKYNFNMPSINFNLESKKLEIKEPSFPEINLNLDSNKIIKQNSPYKPPEILPSYPDMKTSLPIIDYSKKEMNLQDIKSPNIPLYYQEVNNNKKNINKENNPEITSNQNNKKQISLPQNCNKMTTGFNSPKNKINPLIESNKKIFEDIKKGKNVQLSGIIQGIKNQKNNSNINKKVFNNYKKNLFIEDEIGNNINSNKINDIKRLSKDKTRASKDGNFKKTNLPKNDMNNKSQILNPNINGNWNYFKNSGIKVSRNKDSSAKYNLTKPIFLTGFIKGTKDTKKNMSINKGNEARPITPDITRITINKTFDITKDIIICGVIPGIKRKDLKKTHYTNIKNGSSLKNINLKNKNYNNYNISGFNKDNQINFKEKRLINGNNLAELKIENIKPIIKDSNNNEENNPYFNSFEAKFDENQPNIYKNEPKTEDKISKSKNNLNKTIPNCDLKGVIPGLKQLSVNNNNKPKMNINSNNGKIKNLNINLSGIIPGKKVNNLILKKGNSDLKDSQNVKINMIQKTNNELSDLNKNGNVELNLISEERNDKLNHNIQANQTDQNKMNMDKPSIDIKEPKKTSSNLNSYLIHPINNNGTNTKSIEEIKDNKMVKKEKDIYLNENHINFINQNKYIIKTNKVEIEGRELDGGISLVKNNSTKLINEDNNFEMHDNIKERIKIEDVNLNNLGMHLIDDDNEAIFGIEEKRKIKKKGKELPIVGSRNNNFEISKK